MCRENKKTGWKAYCYDEAKEGGENWEAMAGARSSGEVMVFDDAVEAAPGDDGGRRWRRCWLLFPD